MKSRFAYVVTLSLLSFAYLQGNANADGPKPTPDQQRIRALVELLAKWLDDPFEPMLGLPWPTNPNWF